MRTLRRPATLAVSVATEVLGEKAVKGCFLTEVDAGAAVFDLPLQSPDSVHRESLHATLLSRLMQRFQQAQIALSATDPPTFT